MANKYIVLGSTGFIGKHIYRVLCESGFNVKALSRPEFDINDIQCLDFSMFSDATLIDCICDIDSSDPVKTNYKALSKFIEALNERVASFRYIYFSTTAVLNKTLCRDNRYVNSKMLAESYIQEHVNNFAILRLSFPFGAGQSSGRLIPKLVNAVINTQEMKIDDIMIQITPIEFILKVFLEELGGTGRKTSNVLPNERYRLCFIMGYICKYLGKPENFVCVKKNSSDYTAEGIRDASPLKALDLYLDDFR